ncbi:RHS repeat-associated core domain-containing protein [Nocardiopsis xinjiangensis]|uniref:RHS repeat-associated core domain-containing protein n=1 Tax=Nocardiopsis xinjiangensis TaxID=124285 RepID=UPI001F4CF8B9|nr:RHS repeat-associated core domain-containing protein [Nocardiopsis xinjiangensis]
MPTFWSTKRLEQITTRVHDGDEYTTVDSWELEHAFPEPGDGTDPALWLESITHTGHTGGDTESKPAITFGGTPMPNRIDSTTDGLAPMNKWRITAVYTESGGQVDVNYEEPDCDPDDLPEAHENTQLCYPVVRTHNPGADEITDWFAKYPVTELVEVDLVGGQPDQITSYDYVGEPAWRYMDEDGFTDQDQLTWSQWRGFDRVIVRTGHEDEVRTETEHLFFQGMDGDHLPDGTRSVEVTDSEGNSVEDHEVFNGQPREEIVRDGVDGEVVSKTITTPWKNETTQTSHDWDLVAHMTGTEETDTYTALDDGEFRRTRTVNTFDDYGMIESVHDHGDVDEDGDERCTLTTYARNTDDHLLDRVSRTRELASPCGDEPSYPDDVISDERTLYDGGDFGDEPAHGRPTRTQRAVDFDGDTPSYRTATESEFDDYGRAVSVTDAEGNTTTTEHTAAHPGGHDVKVETTNPLGHTTIEEFDARSQPVAEVDADGNRTELAYDPLGRLTEVWLADRNRDVDMSPSKRFEYEFSKDEPTTVTTHTLNASGDYTTSYQLLDGFLRERQTQEAAPGGGRVLTDVFHDSRGNTVIEREPYFNEEEPSGELFVVDNHDEVPRWTRTVHDGAGRATDEIAMSRGVEQWRTSTEHLGDRILMTEPESGTGTTAITDVRGNTVELRKHHGEEPEGDYDSTLYTYTPRDELETVTDPGGNTWSYTYDLLGRQTTEEDPDTGTTRTVYDALDRPVQVTDARGESLYTVYDDLGRRVELRQGDAEGDLRASWEYDTVAVGEVTSSTRHEGGEEYTTEVLTYDDLSRPVNRAFHVPDSEGELAGSYRFRTTFNPDGSVRATTMPGAGALPTEVVVNSYDDLGNLTELAGNDRIITDADYSKIGNLVQREFSRGALGSSDTWQTFDFDEKTNRLDMASVVHEVGDGSLSTQHYDYDDRGNLLRINDEPTAEERADDVQCFEYDHLRRMTQAWTPDATGEEACAADPDAQELGGAAPYWHSFAYDEAGNRVEEVQRGPSGDITRSYSSPEEGEGPAHAVSEVSQDGVSGQSTHSYDYDAAGNMVSRSTGEHDQELEWGPEGKLARVTDGLESTEYVYDAEGERLLRRANGATTLYLPGMEVTWDPAEGTEEATRYFQHADETVAVRENDGVLSWVFSDQHNTGQVAVDAQVGEVVQRRMSVFGQDRGIEGVWPGERGFVDGTVDESTGLTQLGERAYDADLGRFVSVDPLMDLAEAQTMNGYAYSNNSPATFGDPTGLSWHPARGYAPMPDYGSLPSPHPARGYAPMPNYGSLPSPHPARGFAPPTPNVQRAFNSSIDTPKSSHTRRYTSHTVSPQESALNESAHQEEESTSFWESAGNWVSDRYTTDEGWNWGNILGDAGLALGIAGMFACPVCGAAGAIGASLSMGSGAWHVSQGNSGSAAWGLLAGVPLLGGVGVRSVSVIRGSQAQGRWWSHITTNNGVIRNRKREFEELSPVWLQMKLRSLLQQAVLHRLWGMRAPILVSVA